MNLQEKVSFGFFGIGGLGVVFLGYVMYNGIYNGKQREIRRGERYEEVSKAIDLDCNNITDMAEWTKVYATLGKHFDYYQSNPRRELDMNDLEKSLETTKDSLCPK